MKQFYALLISVLLYGYISGTEIEPGDPEDIGPDAPQVTEPTINQSLEEVRLDVRIRNILEHFKQADPRGLPDVPIPDPLPIPNTEGEFTGSKLVLTESHLHGLSQFKIDYIRTDLKDLKVWLSLSFRTLQVLGRYKLSSWLSTSSGDCNVTVTGVQAEGYAKLAVNSEGSLQASDITLDLRFKDIALKLDNLPFFGSILQGVLNSAGPFIFESIKPLLLNMVNNYIQTTFNTQLKNFDQTLPDSIPPVDLAIALARELIRDMNFDPFELPDLKYSFETGLGLKLENGVMRGLSTIHRSGDIQLNYEDGGLVVAIQAATQKLLGQYDWQLDFKFYSPKGKLNLEVDYVDIKIGMKQPVNVEKKPKLEVLKVQLGNIKAQSRGTGTLDSLIEFTVNFVINGFRSLILAAIEKPIKSVLQQELDKLDIQQMIEEKLNDLNNNTERK